MSVVQKESTSGLPSPPALAGGTAKEARKAAIKRAAREIVLVAVLFLAYKLGRVAADGHITEAMSNARDVWHLERDLHLPSEYTLQHAALNHRWLVKIANCYYAYVHFPATLGCLVWMWLRRPERYLYVRRSLAWLTAAALVVHLVMPLAPPRMLTAMGMVDTGKLVGPAVYGSPSSDTLTNQYAAMPSLHFGWALMVAIALIGATKSRWRWLWLLHPIATLLVIVVTGNHYWMDTIVATGLLGVVLAALAVRRPPTVIPRQRLTESQPATPAR
jgi:hypothetical protein